MKVDVTVARYAIELKARLLLMHFAIALNCRRHAGAPMVGWTMYPATAVKVTKGVLKIYKSSEHGRRHFCGDCGTGIFYFNENILPNIVDIQSATYDDPNAVPARVHIQVAERIEWMKTAHTLPEFERYPPQK